jgi:hypothetical protein
MSGIIRRQPFDDFVQCKALGGLEEPKEMPLADDLIVAGHGKRMTYLLTGMQLF